MNRIAVEDRVLAICKGDERYILMFEDTSASKADAVCAVAIWAAHRELSFSWYDAALLIRKILAEGCNGR